jgi:hypothetical protein
MASQASKSHGAATHLCPSATEIDAAPIPLYGNYLPQNLLFPHRFCGAAAAFAAREKRRLFPILLPNPNDAMGDETPVSAIKGYVSHFDLRYWFNGDRFASADRRKHAHAFGSKTHPVAAAQKVGDDLNKLFRPRDDIHRCTP